MASLVDDLLTAGLMTPDNGPAIAFESWKDAVQRSVLKFRFDCDRPRAFEGAINPRSLAGVNFITMDSTKHAAYRDDDTISSSDSHYYVLSLQTSGELRMSQNGRTAVLKPGLFALYDSSRPVRLVSSDDYKSVGIRFAKDQIGVRSGEPDRLSDITATAFECGPGLSSTVWAMVLGIDRSLRLHTLGPSGPLAVRNMMELVAAMLRAELGQYQLEPTNSGNALLHRIRDYIDARLPDPKLGPARIAAAHYISPRYLHTLFSSTDFTVAAWIRARRVELCKQDLADPRMRHVPVAAIARRWGFRGSSHFGQVFKRETGRTPAEFRREMMSGLGSP